MQWTFDLVGDNAATRILFVIIIAQLLSQYLASLVYTEFGGWMCTRPDRYNFTNACGHPNNTLISPVHNTTSLPTFKQILYGALHGRVVTAESSLTLSSIAPLSSVQVRSHCKSTMAEKITAVAANDGLAFMYNIYVRFFSSLFCL